MVDRKACHYDQSRQVRNAQWRDHPVIRRLSKALKLQFAPGISHVRSDPSQLGYRHCLILYHDQVPLKCYGPEILPFPYLNDRVLPALLEKFCGDQRP